MNVRLMGGVMRVKDVGCPRCFVDPGRPCRAQGKATAQLSGEVLRTYHEERKRLARDRAKGQGDRSIDVAAI